MNVVAGVTQKMLSYSASRDVAESTLLTPGVARYRNAKFVETGSA